MYNNTAVLFSGSGKRVNLAHNGTSGSLSRTASDDFSNGVWTNQISISATRTGDWVRATNASGTETGVSNAFDVISSTVHHFTFSSIGTPKTAGVPFPVAITAQDINNNTVSDFNSTVILTDQTGTCDIQSAIFAGGTWSGNVTITKSLTNNTLTATALGKTSSSNQFTVQPASLYDFSISNIASPQVAGTGFSITLTARDFWDNKVVGFSGAVNLYTPIGNLVPTSSGAFTGGECTITSVILTQSQDDATITVTDLSSHTGTSNRFNVIAGALHHYNIDPIADQATGTPFVITVTAKDQNNNTVTTFSGAGQTVGITHIGTGSITPLTSGPFGSGVWSGSIEIEKTQASERIIVTRSGGGPTGQSNVFHVSPSTVDHFVFSTIALVQTAGVPFQVTITAQDANNNTASGFSGTANLHDITGTVSPNQIPFTNGVWTSNLSISRAGADNSLTVNGSGKSGTSSLFNVFSSSAQRFEIADVASPKTAGSAFQLLLTAKDQYGNTATGFNGSVQISDVTGT
ncbi:MAG TPA: hypothetical protein VGB38_06400, partial [bacterium]